MVHEIGQPDSGRSEPPMNPTLTSEGSSARWDDLRIVPIRSDFIASRFAIQAACRVSRDARPLICVPRLGMVLLDGFSLNNGGPIW